MLHVLLFWTISFFTLIIHSYILILAASMRLCMGSRRGFICRMKIGNLNPESMSAGHLNRLKQRNSLGLSRDGQNFAVIHCTGYIKNWPPTGQFDNPLTGLYIFCVFFLLHFRLMRYHVQ